MVTICMGVKNTTRANTSGTSEKYYRRSIYVPYMDSLIQSLKTRFSETNTPAFMLYWLHPAQLEKAERPDYKEMVQTIHQFYNFNNFEQDAMSWYDVTKEGNFSLKTRKNWNLWTW